MKPFVRICFQAADNDFCEATVEAGLPGDFNRGRLAIDHLSVLGQAFVEATDSIELLDYLGITMRWLTG